MWRSWSGEQTLKIPVATGLAWKVAQSGQNSSVPPTGPHFLYPLGLIQNRKSIAHSQVAPLCALCPTPR